MKLQEKLDAMKKELIGSKPPEIVDIMSQEVENLVNSGIADKATQAGDAMPAFTLPDERGNLVSSRELLSKGPLAISFYRGIW